MDGCDNWWEVAMWEVWMVDKQPQSNSKEFQAVLLGQGASVSARTIRQHLNDMKRNGRRPRRTQLLTQRRKKARLQFAKRGEENCLRTWKLKYINNLKDILHLHPSCCSFVHGAQHNQEFYNQVNSVRNLLLVIRSYCVSPLIHPPIRVGHTLLEKRSLELHPGTLLRLCSLVICSLEPCILRWAL